MTQSTSSKSDPAPDGGPVAAIRRMRDWVEAHPPPGPSRHGFWRSPLRGPWLTAVFGSVLLVGVVVMFATGLLSYLAYNPDLAGNDTKSGSDVLKFFLFDWPTQPYWLYRVTQGLHVTLGIVLIPILLAKLWSVIPKLFEWPPVTSPAQGLERLSLLALVGGAVFTFATGVMNIQYWYAFPGSFYTLHYYSAWVFIGAFLTHVVVRTPRMIAALRTRRLRTELRTDLAHTEQEPPDDYGLVTSTPGPASMSRRGVLGLVGASSLALFALTVGQSLGGPLRSTALLSPRGRDLGDGPNDFAVNKTAASSIDPAKTGDGYRLVLRGGGREVSLTRAELMAMPQHRAALPIACVEGWSTTNQDWEGVRLADLAAMAGMPDADAVFVQSLQARGAFKEGRLRGNQIRDPNSLLALRVNGVDLSLDHGFPARVIVPNNPGVRNTKWVTRLTFEGNGQSGQALDTTES